MKTIEKMENNRKILIIACFLKITFLLDQERQTKPTDQIWAKTNHVCINYKQKSLQIRTIEN